MSGHLQGGFGRIAHFRDVAGHDPWPWQRELYARLVGGDVPHAVHIPTGLGKTACVLLALLARIENASLPRRIVYVVDRRAVVDQTGDAVRAWIDRMAALPALARAFDAGAAFPAERPVALGVLRGGLADDGAWRLDPARAAVLVGTVDMVGSRLLFSGYGDGRSMRALHAGLLGHDALVMLDEAHLAPAFATLLASVEGLRPGGGFRAVTLSATGVARGRRVHGLGAHDLTCDALCRRLHAPKTLRFESVATPAARVAGLCRAALSHRTGAVAVYVERVEDAARIAARLARACGAERVALLTGTLRGRERAALAEGAVWARFDSRRERGVSREALYLVATAAGEVGVDLDADHAVMDCSTLDSMIQRLGRINRTGAGTATVTVVALKRGAQRQGTPPVAKSFTARREAARKRTLEVLRALPDASPATLHAIDDETLAACSVSRIEPARLDAVVVEAFAATSAALPLPPVGVYLRGVAEGPVVPETHLAWRWDVPELVGAGAHAARAVLAFHRPRAAELARVPTPVAERLVARALAHCDGRGLPVVVLGADGEVSAATLDDDATLPSFAYATVLLPPHAGGLTGAGLPDAAAEDEVADVADDDDRVRFVESPGEDEAGAPPAWVCEATALRIPVAEAETGARILVYARRRPDPGGHGAEADLGWLGASTRSVDAHCAEVGAAARRIAAALGLDAALVEALGAAGDWHDAGKARAVWQRAAGVPAGAVALAKVRGGRFRHEWLGGYRHEFGSLGDAERALPADAPHRELVLHLVAAHHGWARPGFPHPRQWDPEDRGCANRARAQRVAERYARLQAEHGPWRLAWLEAIVKAADAWASASGGARG